MRALVKTIGTLLILFAAIGGTFYVYRSHQAKAMGREYSLSDVPRDLYAELSELMKPVRSPAKEKPADSPGEAGETTAASSPKKEPPPRPVDPFLAANSAYLAGRLADAKLLLDRALEIPGATRKRPEAMLARIRLFEILLKGVEPGRRLEGPAAALLTMPGGRRMLVTVIDEMPDEIEFRAPRGIRSRVKKSKLRDYTVARSRAQRIALFERLYRLRHETARTAGDFLALARFSSECGLSDHLTYCLERALKAPGDEIRTALEKEYAAALAAGDERRRELLEGLFRRFFPRSVLSEAAPSPEPPSLTVEKEPGEARPSPTGSGGIGGVTERRVSRLGNPKVAALLDEAEKLCREGDRYYRKAFDGGDKTAEYREKALAAYHKAEDIYENVEETWGISLDRTFKELQTKIYDLIKSSR